jgi:hypothetical protein
MSSGNSFSQELLALEQGWVARGFQMGAPASEHTDSASQLDSQCVWRVAELVDAVQEGSALCRALLNGDDGLFDTSSGGHMQRLAAGFLSADAAVATLLALTRRNGGEQVPESATALVEAWMSRASAVAAQHSLEVPSIDNKQEKDAEAALTNTMAQEARRVGQQAREVLLDYCVATLEEAFLMTKLSDGKQQHGFSDSALWAAEVLVHVCPGREALTLLAKWRSRAIDAGVGECKGGFEAAAGCISDALKADVAWMRRLAGLGAVCSELVVVGVYGVKLHGAFLRTLSMCVDAAEAVTALCVFADTCSAAHALLERAAPQVAATSSPSLLQLPCDALASPMAAHSTAHVLMDMHAAALTTATKKAVQEWSAETGQELKETMSPLLLRAWVALPLASHARPKWCPMAALRWNECIAAVLLIGLHAHSFSAHVVEGLASAVGAWVTAMQTRYEAHVASSPSFAPTQVKRRRLHTRVACADLHALVSVGAHLQALCVSMTEMGTCADAVQCVQAVLLAQTALQRRIQQLLLAQQMHDVHMRLLAPLTSFEWAKKRDIPTALWKPVTEANATLYMLNLFVRGTVVDMNTSGLSTLHVASMAAELMCATSHALYHALTAITFSRFFSRNFTVDLVYAIFLLRSFVESLRPHTHTQRHLVVDACRRIDICAAKLMLFCGVLHAKSGSIVRVLETIQAQSMDSVRLGPVSVLLETIFTIAGDVWGGSATGALDLGATAIDPLVQFRRIGRVSDSLTKKPIDYTAFDVSRNENPNGVVLRNDAILGGVSTQGEEGDFEGPTTRFTEDHASLPVEWDRLVLEGLCAQMQDEKQAHGELVDESMTLACAEVLSWVSRRYDMQSDDFPFLTEDEEAGASEIKVALVRHNKN